MKMVYRFFIFECKLEASLIIQCGLVSALVNELFEIKPLRTGTLQFDSLLSEVLILEMIISQYELRL